MRLQILLSGIITAIFLCGSSALQASSINVRDTISSSTTPLDIDECKRALRAALVREYIWNNPPIAYDRNGDPAIAIKFVAEASGSGGDLQAIEDAILSIVQNTECVISDGKWATKPIDVVDRKGYKLAHYDGKILIVLDLTAIISIPTCEKYRINCFH
jgi:hypothetical protein